MPFNTLRGYHCLMSISISADLKYTELWIGKVKNFMKIKNILYKNIKDYVILLDF